MCCCRLRPNTPRYSKYTFGGPLRHLICCIENTNQIFSFFVEHFLYEFLMVIKLLGFTRYGKKKKHFDKYIKVISKYMQLRA